MADLISIVVPVYNGENSLAELYSGIKKTTAKNNFDFELIFIDDNSPDQSYKKILELNKKDNRVKGIQLAENFGQQNAIFCGFNYATGDYIITMDDDLQHRPEDIKLLYHKIKTGFDVVYAIPETRDYTFYRSMGSKLTNKLFNLITPKSEDLRVSSFRIINREIMAKILASDKSFIYISAIILQEKAKVGNVYTRQEQRKYGESNYNFIKLFKLFLKLYIYYGKLPLLKYLRSQSKQYLIKTSTFADEN
jgi:undecaprenyl-phosphate 4-deoxy-4-formamido-L-arabinose transferase